MSRYAVARLWQLPIFKNLQSSVFNFFRALKKLRGPNHHQDGDIRSNDASAQIASWALPIRQRIDELKSAKWSTFYKVLRSNQLILVTYLLLKIANTRPDLLMHELFSDKYQTLA